MRWWPPLVLHGAHRAKDEAIEAHARHFAERLRAGRTIGGYCLSELVCGLIDRACSIGNRSSRLAKSLGSITERRGHNAGVVGNRSNSLGGALGVVAGPGKSACSSLDLLCSFSDCLA